jgi:hypothetical protein
MQPIGEDSVIGTVEDCNHMVTTEDYNMEAIEVNIIVATEGDKSVGFYSLLIVGELSRGLRRGSAAAGLLGLQVRVPPVHEFLL